MKRTTLPLSHLPHRAPASLRVESAAAGVTRQEAADHQTAGLAAARIAEGSAHQGLIPAVHDSPRQLAQSKQLGSVFGEAAGPVGHAPVGATTQAAWTHLASVSQLQAAPMQFWPRNMSQHARDRAAQRGVTEAGADAAMGATQYDDPDYPGATVYHDPGTGTAICVAADGTVTTCYIQARPKGRWTPKA